MARWIIARPIKARPIQAGGVVRRRFGRAGSAVVAAGTAAALLGGLGVTASQAAWSDVEYGNGQLAALDCVDGTGFATTGWGKFLSASALGADLAPAIDFSGLTVTNAAPGTTGVAAGVAAPTDLGDDAFSSPIDLSALSTVQVSAGVSLFAGPDPDTGAYTQYAQAHANGESTGASGLITDAVGGVALGTPDAASPDIGGLALSSVLNGVVAGSGTVAADELADPVLRVGQVASLSTLDACAPLWAGDDLTDHLVREYLVSELDLGLRSSLVTDLVTSITGEVNALEDDLDLLLDEQALTGATFTTLAGLINGVLTGLAATIGPLAGGTVNSIVVDADFELAPVLALLTGDIHDADGLVTVNLGTGAITADLEGIAGGLAGKAPNTSLLTPAILGDISTRVGQALTDFVNGTLAPAITAQLLAATVTVDIGATLQILTQNVNLATTITGSLGQFTGALPGDPVVVSEITAGSGVLNLLDVLLGGTLSAVLTSITAGLVAPLLTDVVPQIGSLVLAPLIADGGAADLLVDATVLELTGTLIPGLLADLAPVFGLLGSVLQVSVNAQPDQAGDVPFPNAPIPPDVPVAGRFFVSALRIAALDLASDPLLEVNLASSSVGPNVPR